MNFKPLRRHGQRACLEWFSVESSTDDGSTIERQARMRHQAAFLHRARNSALLVSLTLLILISPLFEGRAIGHLVVDALFSLVLLAAVNAASDNRGIRLVALGLAILALGLMWANTVDPSSPGRLAGVSLFILLSSIAMVLVLRHIVLAPSVTFEVITAGIGLYLMLGVTWALTYLLLDAIHPAAFEIVSANQNVGWSEVVYFSFATLPTLGYGDVSPDSPFVRIWAVMEAVTGVLYIAILVARLVSLYRS
jgi:hypothetical protein